MTGLRRLVRLTPVARACAAAALTTLLVATDGAELGAQNVGGRVVDAATGAGVGGATLRLLDARKTAIFVTVTDESGRFMLRAGEDGSYMVEAERIGYTTTQAGPVRVEVGAVTEVELRLSTTAVALEPIRVLVQPRNERLDRVNYYLRQGRHQGIFMDRGEIERRNPIDMASLLRGHPGVRVTHSRDNGSLQLILRGGTTMNLSGDVCPPKVFINGAAIHAFDFRDITPGELEGIEIYPGASAVPAQFGGSSSACGVVLLWIRTG